MTSHINIIEHRKEPNHMTLEFQVLTGDRHTHVAIVNVLFISSSLCRKNNCSIQNKKTHTNAQRG